MTHARAVRPTLRCTKEDLGLSLPPFDEPLHELDHALVRGAQQQADDAKTERIVSIDDTVLLKLKPGGSRWRGALWDDTEAGVGWLVAAGIREAGARDDFYGHLSAECRRKRTLLNRQGLEPAPGKKTYSKHLLPDEDDRLRLRAEGEFARLREAQARIPELVKECQNTPGVPYETEAFGTRVEAFVYRAVGSYDELYLGLRIVGPAPDNVHGVILKLAVPEVGPEDWCPVEEARHRGPAPGEVFYFTLLEVPQLRS